MIRRRRCRREDRRVFRRSRGLLMIRHSRSRGSLLVIILHRGRSESHDVDQRFRI